MRQTHVVILHNYPAIANLFAFTCEEAGYVATEVATTGDALMVLRSSLHPLVAIVDCDYSSSHADEPFFQTIYHHPDLYRQHRYIAMHAADVPEEERRSLEAMRVPLVGIPFTLAYLMDLVGQAASELS